LTIVTNGDTTVDDYNDHELHSNGGPDIGMMADATLRHGNDGAHYGATTMELVAAL
jgi:hypothetical protein